MVEILIDALGIYEDCTQYIFYSSKNENYKKYKKVRMHDVFLKYGMSLFIQYFNKNYNKNSNIITLYDVFNTRPTMTFVKKVNGFDTGIQIEDLEYRYFVVCKERDLKKFENKGWLNPDWKSKTGKKYRKYKDKNGKYFYYQFDLIVPNQDFNSLSKKIIKDMKRI
jgi:hypothetical protein